MIERQIHNQYPRLMQMEKMDQMNQEFIKFDDTETETEMKAADTNDTESGFETDDIDIDTDTENSEDVKSLIRSKNVLERHSERMNASDHQAIMDFINEYLLKYCNHNKIHDLIDITPDKSMNIIYCDKCYCTFK